MRIARPALARFGRTVIRTALALSADWKEFAFLQEEPVVKNEEPVVVNQTHTVTASGKYTITLYDESLDPGSVLLNGEEILTVYGQHVDVSVTIYAVTFDVIEVVGSKHRVMKVEYV